MYFWLLVRFVGSKASYIVVPPLNCAPTCYYIHNEALHFTGVFRQVNSNSTHFHISVAYVVSA